MLRRSGSDLRGQFGKRARRAASRAKARFCGGGLLSGLKPGPASGATATRWVEGLVGSDSHLSRWCCDEWGTQDCGGLERSRFASGMIRAPSATAAKVVKKVWKVWPVGAYGLVACFSRAWESLAKRCCIAREKGWPSLARMCFGRENASIM